MGKHDIAHKEFYSHPENIKDLLRGFVALDCIEQFDFSSLERENTSFVAKENTERHDDIIWFLSAVFDNPAYEEALTLEEVIRMTKTFRDYDRENDKKSFTEEGRKEGKLSAFYDLIKRGLITLEQAASTIGVTKDQLLADFKECNLVL